MTKNIAFYGVFASIAIVIAYIERLFPIPIPLPGIKLGLANVAVIIMLYISGTKAAFSISTIRIIVVGFLFGSIFSMAYSLAGGILSFLAMCGAKKIRVFGIVGVSVIGGVSHNIGQIAIAAAIVQHTGLFYYSPALIIAGVVTGGLIGYVGGITIRHLKNIGR